MAAVAPYVLPDGYKIGFVKITDERMKLKLFDLAVSGRGSFLIDGVRHTGMVYSGRAAEILGFEGNISIVIEDEDTYAGPSDQLERVPSKAPVRVELPAGWSALVKKGTTGPTVAYMHEDGRLQKDLPVGGAGGGAAVGGFRKSRRRRNNRK